MAKFIVKKDIAILDKGKEEQDRFFVLEDAVIDELGSPDEDTLERMQQAMLTQCANPNKDNDRGVYFNGGDVIYTSYASGRKLEKFMIDIGALVLS